jgi:hypothetical protein
MRIEIRPAFDDAVMAAELPIRKAAARMLTLLQQLDLPQLWTHRGLNFEKLHGMTEPLCGEQLYSLRVTGSASAITSLLKGPTVVLISLHTQHDKAY